MFYGSGQKIMAHILLMQLHSHVGTTREDGDEECLGGMRGKGEVCVVDIWPMA